MKKGRAFQSAFFKGWVVFAVLGMVAPILLFCLLGGIFFFGFRLWQQGEPTKQDWQTERERVPVP